MEKRYGHRKLGSNLLMVFLEKDRFFGPTRDLVDDPTHRRVTWVLLADFPTRRGYADAEPTKLLRLNGGKNCSPQLMFSPTPESRSAPGRHGMFDPGPNVLRQLLF